MDESKLALERELGQIFGQPYEEGLITLERETVMTCGNCGAWLRLMGIPPETLPEEPKIALYYPVQFCPNCGTDAGRALDIELFPLPGIPGAPVYHEIACPQCASKLEYMVQALPPQYLEELYCPVCGTSLGVRGQTVEILEKAPWPADRVVAEEPDREIPIVAGAVIMLVATGIIYLVTRKYRR